jgi:15-cis-phytoene synthase
MLPLSSPNADRDLDLKTSRTYAGAMIRTYSKSFYLASLLLPRELREDVHCLYAFCRYSDNIVDAPRPRGRDELQGELDAWRHELHSAYRTGESQHPVMAGFVHVAARYSIKIDLPLDLIKGVEMDLLIDRYETFKDLYQFCYRVASVVGLMMTKVIGTSDEAAFLHAEQLGIGMQLANILRDVAEDWKLRGKIYLPQEDLRTYGVTDDAIARSAMSPQMRELLKFQVDRAHSYFREAQKGIPMLSGKGQFAIDAAARLYQGILTEIERNEYDVFSRRPVVGTSRKIRFLATSYLRLTALSRRRRRAAAAAE